MSRLKISPKKAIDKISKLSPCDQKTEITELVETVNYLQLLVIHYRKQFAISQHQCEVCAQRYEKKFLDLIEKYNQ